MGWKASAAAAAMILSLAEAAGAQAPGPDTEYLLLSRALTNGAKCNWFNPVERAALEAARAERLAAVQAAVDSAAAEAVRTRALAVPAYDCSGPTASADKGAALGAAQSVGAVMMVRADVALRATEPWAQQITTLDAHQPTIRMAVGQIQAADRNAFAQFQAREAPAALRALALVCPARKSLRTVKGPRACPAVPGVDARAQTYAAAWLAGVESFVAAYAGSPETKAALAAAAAQAAAPSVSSTPALPPGAPEWSQVYVSTETPSDFEVGSNIGGVLEADCKAGDIVAVLDGAPPEQIIGRKELKLYRLGSPGTLGSVTATGSMVGTLMPLGAPSMPGFHAKGALRRCRSPN